MTSMDPKQLAAEAKALKAQGRFDEAISLFRRLVAIAPASAAAEHNLASALGDAGRWREAERHIRLAFSKGVDAPESWLVLGRCLQSLNQFDEAEQAFGEALRRRPAFGDAHKDLAQLRWMRSGELSTALSELDRALAQAPGDAGLAVVKAKVLEYAGKTDAAYALVMSTAAAQPGNVVALAAASQLAAAAGESGPALALAERAAALAPAEPVVATTLIAACLGAGDAARASALAEHARARFPLDQHAIALQATAWRLMNDARYRELYDYDAFVFTSVLDTPAGWHDLPSYIADLSDALTQSHRFTTHPFDQSVRHGSQVPDILSLGHPALAALPDALDGPIRRYIAGLGRGGDPMRSRNLGGYAISGIWSIRMHAGGFHIDHVHPQGWVSSACYVQAPRGLSGRQGWLKFGEPGVPTKPALDAEHYVEPVPGKLALFPSYMWHGTVPFTDDAVRMTCAFDLSPAPPQSGGSGGASG